jgi:SpoIID/LytB domain protein
VLIVVAPHDDEPGARAEAAALAARFAVETAVHPELVERPRGTVEASDERGTVIANDGILWFSPKDGGALVEVGDIEEEGGGRVARRYHGKIYVTLDGAGTLAVVNAVPEDRLLFGLVPAEMSPGSPAEALKAQAVAARNELLAKLGTRHLTDPYRLCSTQHCQVYAGAGREDPRTTAAVEATRGELLVRDSGGLVDAVYSAACGGHGENNESAWGGAPDPSLRGVPDGPPAAQSGGVLDDDPRVGRFLDEAAQAFCARPRGAASSHRWTVQLDLAQVAARAAVGQLTRIEVLGRGVSGRVTAMRLWGDGGQKEVHGELAVRRLLGNLKSSLFVLAPRSDGSGHLVEVTVQGGGHGHGVGMCQLGAVGRAEAGASYRDILSHYYRGAHVKKLY